MDAQKILDQYSKGLGRKYQPLQVTFQLSTPIATSDFIHFDGILSYLIMKDALGEDFYNLEDNKNILYNIPLPIEEGGKEKKYFASSIGIFDEKAEGVSHWRKRWAEKFDNYVDFGKKKGRIDKGSGKFKMYDMPFAYISSPEIKFYVYGDKEEINRLLLNLSAIGKKVTQGYGKIKDFNIKGIERDISCFNDGVIMRPIPTTEVEDEIISKIKGFWIRYYAYRPPYWHPLNFDRCLIPCEV